MSISISINFCQKVCVTIPSQCISNLTYTWTNVTPNLITVLSNGGSAILIPVYPNSGNAIVIVQDSSGSTITLNITIASLFVPVPNAKYQYVYSTSIPITAPFLIPFTINGPFNSLISPPQNDICSLVFTNNGDGSEDWVLTSAYVPGSTSSITGTRTWASNTADMTFVLIKPTANVNIDPLIPFGSRVDGLVKYTSVQIGLNSYDYFMCPTGFTDPPCPYQNYISIVQPVTPSPGIVFGSQFLSDGNIYIIATLVTVTDFNVLLVPNQYFNISSNDLVYTATATYTPPTPTFVFTLPNIPVGSVMWVAQCNTLSFAFNSLVVNIVHNSSTQLTVSLSNNGPNTPRTLAIVAYKNQSNVGYSVSFP